MKHYGGKGEGWQLGAPKKAEKRNVSISRKGTEKKDKKEKGRQERMEQGGMDRSSTWARPIGP